METPAIKYGVCLYSKTSSLIIVVFAILLFPAHSSGVLQAAKPPSDQIIVGEEKQSPFKEECRHRISSMWKIMAVGMRGAVCLLDSSDAASAS